MKRKTLTGKLTGGLEANLDKKNKVISEMAPGLRSALGYEIGPDEKPSPNELPDAVADAIFENRWGFARPASDGGNSAPAQKPLSRAEIAQSLANLAKTLGNPGFTSTAQLIQKLAEAAREQMDPDNPTRLFLEGYAAGDKSAMRSAVKKLVQASRDEIIKYAKAGGNPLDLLVKDDKLPN